MRTDRFNIRDVITAYTYMEGSEEILFFGAIYEPNLWNGSTCPNN